MGKLILLSLIFLQIAFAIQKNQYEKGFKAFDDNHNGFLQKQEFRNLYIYVLDEKLPESKGAQNQNTVKNNFKNFFGKFDHNLDKKISFDEFFKSVQKFLSLYDQLESNDNKSSISKKNSTQKQVEDYKKLAQKSSKLLQETNRKIEKDQYEIAFKAFDGNHNGFLQKQEFRDLLIQILDKKQPESKGAQNQNSVKNRLEGYFDEYDHNLDKKISFDEFFETLDKSNDNKSSISKKNSTQKQVEDYEKLAQKSWELLQKADTHLQKAQKLYKQAGRIYQEIKKLDENEQHYQFKKSKLLSQHTRLRVQGYESFLQVKRLHSLFEESYKLRKKSIEQYKRSPKQQGDQIDQL